MEIKTVHFDISPEGQFCNGTLTLCDGYILKTLDGNEEKFNIEGMEEALQITDIGCGRLELKPQGADADGSSNIIICRFSMSQAIEIGELVRVLNHYFENGEILSMNTEDLPICPKCHRHYPRAVNACIYCTDKSYVFSRAFGYFKPYIKSVVGAGLLLTVANILAAIMPLFNSVLIDHYLVPTADATPFFESRTTGIIVIALLMSVTYALSKCISIFSNRITNRVGSSFSNELRSIVYSKIQDFSVASMSEKSAGNLIHRVTKDTDRIRDFFNQQGRYLIEQVIMFTVILVILFCTNVKLTLAVIIPIPIGVMLMKGLGHKLRLRFHKQWRVESKTTAILHDIIKGIRVIKTFGSEEREIKKFAKYNKIFADVCSSNEKFWAVVFPLVGNFMAVGEFLVLIIGGKMVLDGELTLGELTRFNLYLAFLYAPLRWIAIFPRRLTDCTTSLLKIYDILDEPVQMLTTNKPQTVNPDGELEFENVTFGYKNYETVLKNINLTIKPGEMIGLVGHSGVGKSTMINLCMRLYDPSAGKITIDGVDIKDIDPKELRKNIGVVFQETYLFSGTIFDNIVFGQPNASLDSVIAAAKAANAHEFITALPDGYNTVIGENGHSLSGGERQRLSIARAILKNPKILILDEATSSLDPETELKIQEALARLIEGRTTIAIAHRLSTLKNANRLVILDKGRIAEMGSHNELIAQGGIYASLVCAQRQTSSLQ